VRGPNVGPIFKSLLPVTLILFGCGALLIYDSILNSTPFQGAEVIGGASLLALGLIAGYPQVRLALRWMQLFGLTTVETHSTRSEPFAMLSGPLVQGRNLEPEKSQSTCLLAGRLRLSRCFDHSRLPRERGSASYSKQNTFRFGSLFSE